MGLRRWFPAFAARAARTTTLAPVVAGAVASVLAFVLACVLANPARAAPHGPFLKAPYVQSLHADSVEVRLELDPPAGAVLEISQISPAPSSARSIEQPDVQASHVFHVDKLAPLTRYDYFVRAGGAVSGKGTFTTAPRESSPGDAASFKFLVYGDTRSDDAAHAVLVRALLQAPGDFIVNTGDFVERGGSARDWQTFFDIEGPLLRDRCVFACVGNHELFDDAAGAAYARYFGPSNGKLYGTFRWSNARFFLLNAFHSWTGGEEREWLTRELEHADTEPDLAWRIVVVHQGPFSAGIHGASLDLRAAKIPELLSLHKVDLVVSGHDHIYERGLATAPSYDLRYVVSGGGGAPLYRDITPLASTRKVEAAYHVIEAEVTESAVNLVARRADGSILERCGFTHSPGWTCDGAKLASPGAGSLAATGSPPPAASLARSTAPQGKPGATDPASPRCACRAVGASTARRAPAAALAIAGLLGVAVAIRRARRTRRPR